MELLNTIAQIAQMAFQICAFLIALLASWIIILAGKEICRDKKQNKTFDEEDDLK